MIRAAVNWNERQLIADQAMLTGVRNVPTGAARPLRRSELSRLREEYRRLLGVRHEVGGKTD
ncbi:MAG: hypothetical protein LBJ59_12490 [Zoogloeaceae bacterium]|nr:hypothetical protein [Zoogloeaceae bacterium]